MQIYNVNSMNLASAQIKQVSDVFKEYAEEVSRFTEATDIQLYNLNSHHTHQTSGLLIFFGSIHKPFIAHSNVSKVSLDVVTDQDAFSANGYLTRIDEVGMDAYCEERRQHNNSYYPESWHLIKDENGTTIAIYNQKRKVFDVLIEILAIDSAVRARFLHYVFGKFLELLRDLYAEKDPYSERGRAKFLERLKGIANESRNNEIRQYQDNIRHDEENIRQYTEHITVTHRRILERREKIEVLQQMKDGSGKMVEQFELILDHERIKNLKLINNHEFQFDVPDVIATDANGVRYYIGNFTIKVNMSNCSIKFTNNGNRRTSHWGRNCHHPHVSEHGDACLGNVSSTLAELNAHHEFYALALVCIDFLEAVNVEDTAGRKAPNWDTVDENDKPTGFRTIRNSEETYSNWLDKYKEYMKKQSQKSAEEEAQ